MVLKDKYGRIHDYLRISLSDKCNLRCFYCLPEDSLKKSGSSNSPIESDCALSLTQKQQMSREELVDIARTFVDDFGVNKIRLTGGEPLIRKDATGILEDLSKLPVELRITTNAVFLHKFLDQFERIGLKSINISLDSLIESKFTKITKRAQFNRVMDNIKEAVFRGFEVKINTVTLHKVNDDEILDFIEWTREMPVDVRFIEFMPFSGNDWGLNKVVTHDDILRKVRNVYPTEKINDKPHSTAQTYRVPGFKGTFGVIGTVTTPFCSSCNRIRLTADGKLKNCLFSNEEADLLSAVRSNQDIKPLITKCILDKHAERAGLQDLRKADSEGLYEKGRTMTAIGG